MAQDASCNRVVEDNDKNNSKQVLKDECFTSTFSKKLKSFHSKDDKPVEHSMEHANESTEKQQDDAVNLQVVFTNWECNFFFAAERDFITGDRGLCGDCYSFFCS